MHKGEKGENIRLKIERSESGEIKMKMKINMKNMCRDDCAAERRVES